MIGIYPLATHPTTFDFAAWCVIAKTHGVNHVRFVVEGRIDDRKYPEDVAWRRFGNILVPLCKLAGLRFSVGDDVEGRKFPYLYGHVNKTYDAFGRISKLTPEHKAKCGDYVTITLRQSFRNNYRDSNMSAWEGVQKSLERDGKRVVVISDNERAPMYLEDRMQIYAEAEMNLGASGGPLTLQHFSDAPYLTFNLAAKRPPGEDGYDAEALMASSGFTHGSQFSFRHARQKLVWKPDTFENIMEAYDEMESMMAAA